MGSPVGLSRSAKLWARAGRAQHATASAACSMTKRVRRHREPLSPPGKDDSYAALRVGLTIGLTSLGCGGALSLAAIASRRVGGNPVGSPGGIGRLGHGLSGALLYPYLGVRPCRNGTAPSGNRPQPDRGNARQDPRGAPSRAPSRAPQYERERTLPRAEGPGGDLTVALPHRGAPSGGQLLRQLPQPAQEEVGHPVSRTLQEARVVAVVPDAACEAVLPRPGRVVGVEEPPAHFTGQGQRPIIALGVAADILRQLGVKEPVCEEEAKVQGTLRPRPLHVLRDARPVKRG